MAVAIPNDLYVLPSGEDEKFILYRPSQHTLALISSECRELVARALQKPASDHGTAAANCDAIVEKLLDANFLDRTTHSPAAAARSTPHVPFMPHDVVLDITNKCNMRCVYCYARGGDHSVTMTEACGRAAIDFCVGNAQSKGSTFGLHFHGGGEPSREFHLLQQLCSYAKERSAFAGVQMASSVITNGLISSAVVDFFCTFMDEMTISLDGDEAAQDAHRRTDSGKSTFARVFKTAKMFYERGKRFNIRVTITSKTLTRMKLIAEFLTNEFPECTLNFEPVASAGRALDHSDLACDMEQLGTALYDVMRYAAEKKVVLFYSGISDHSDRKEFCSASVPSFCVGANGQVTSCFSYSNREPVREMFIYGSFDDASGRFSFDESKIKRLQNLPLNHDNYCAECFCRTHCLGDCPAIRRFRTVDGQYFEELSETVEGNRRCATNRKIMLLLLNDIARKRVDPSAITVNTVTG